MPHKLYKFFINVDMNLLDEEDQAELLENLNVKGRIFRIRMNLKGAILFDIVDGDDIITILTFGDRLRDEKGEFVKYNGNIANHLKNTHGIDIDEEILVIYEMMKAKSKD